MTEKEQKEPNGHADPADGYYVYCVAEEMPAERLVSQSLPTAIDDAGLELISSDMLSAIVSRVPMSTFGNDALPAHLSDATWVAVRAMRHEQVVEHFARQTSVVPLRFGTIYRDGFRVEQMLTEKRDELSAIIQRLSGKEEWGVNVYCDRATLLDSIVKISPRLREMSEAARSASPGQAYLLNKKIEALRADEGKVEVERVVGEIEERLKSESDDVVRLRILKVETTEHGELKAKFAFLVMRTKFERFKNSAEDLARQIEETGIRIELTGPWPAYNFAGASGVKR